MAISGQSVLTIHENDERTRDFVMTGTTSRVKVAPVFDDERRTKLRDLVWISLEQSGLTDRQIEAVCRDAARRKSQINDRLRAIRFELSQRGDG